jgi:NADH dehydrogenase
MHRVVIVGCGFGGLFAAKALRRAPVEVVVIDRTNHHLFQALLYQVATGVLSEGDIAPPIRDVLRRQRNTKVVLGEVVDVDVERREVMIDTLGDATTLVYDSLIVATGASQSYFGHDEYALDAPGMKTIDDALELRGRIFGAFEAGRARAGRGRPRALADVRHRRRRPHRRGAGGPDRRALPPAR